MLEVGIWPSVSCMQLWRLCLTFAPTLSLRRYKVGPAGLPLAGRPGDPTIWPPIFVDGLDCLLEVGGEGLGPKHVIDRPVGLP